MLQNGYLILKTEKINGGTMQKAKRVQVSFFDLIYDHSVPANHFLRKLNESIDWNRFERHVEHLHASGKGRPAHNALLMTKTLILQFLYDLSDRQLEEQIQDRISFRFFFRS
jgi:transposase